MTDQPSEQSYVKCMYEYYLKQLVRGRPATSQASASLSLLLLFSGLFGTDSVILLNVTTR